MALLEIQLGTKESKPNMGAQQIHAWSFAFKNKIIPEIPELINGVEN